MTQRKKEVEEFGSQLARAVMWLLFAFIAIIALAVALRIGLWIVGA